MCRPLSGLCALVLAAMATPLLAQGDAEVVYAIAEKMPEYTGGSAALRTFLVSNFQFPVEALEATVTGPVQVSFVVGSNGALRDAKVVRGQHPALDDEALRLVRAMPPWTPGQQRGKPVSVLYTMPIRFAMPPKKTPPEEKRVAQAP